MTNEQLEALLEKHDSVLSGPMIIKDILSAIREAMRLDSIGFADWCSNDGWIFYEQIGETRFWKNNIRNSVNQKTDQLYEKYLEYLKTTTNA